MAVLSGAVEPRHARLSRADRLAVVEILRDTEPNLPDYFQGEVGRIARLHAPVRSMTFGPAAISISRALRSGPWMTVAV